MTFKKLGDMFDDKNIKHTNDMATVVSAGVNGWSAKLYAEVDGDAGEAVRSTFLGISDILSLAKESTLVKSMTTGHANSVVQTIVLADRFLENSIKLVEDAQDYNGFVKTSTLIDLFADGAAIFSPPFQGDLYREAF